MPIHIETIDSIHFRGIHDLSVEALNHINIVTGDNNSGKTSLLEAILFLRNPNDLTNILRIALVRDVNDYFAVASVYGSFINLFPRHTKKLEVSINAKCKGKKIEFGLSGEQKMIMLDPEDAIKKAHPDKRNRIMCDMNSDLVEIDAFSGQLISTVNETVDKIAVEINAYSTITGMEIRKNNLINVVYLASAAHIRGFAFDCIVRNDEYKEDCLQILKLFDSEIMDLLILKDLNTGKTREYIKHEKAGHIPLSTYGDGIKKVLSMANAIAKAAGGVLLIDEVDNAIHAKYYEDIFRFIVRASLQFDVQIFMTTQSIEAIDALLATQEYDHQGQKDEISILTLKKINNELRTYSRVLKGRHVYTSREQFGFEVRL